LIQLKLLVVVGGGGKKLVSVTFLPHTCFVPAE